MTSAPTTAEALDRKIQRADPLRLALGYGFALGASALFALGGVIAKGAFAAGLAPSELAELRALFGFLVLVTVIAVVRRESLRVRLSDLPLLLFFGVFALGAIQWAYYEAIQRLPLGVALVIQYTGPLLMLVFLRLRGRSVGGRLWGAAALALVGSYFVVGAYDAALVALNAIGIFLALLSAVIFAGYFLLAERILARYTIWTLLAYGFGAAVLAWMVVRPLWLLPWGTVADPRVALLVAGVIVVGTTLPFALIFASVRLIPAARTGLTATAEPVIGAAAAWILLNEALGPLQLAGGATVLVAIAIAQSLRPERGGV